MKRQVVISFILALSAFTALASGASPPNGSEFSEADKKAYSYLRVYNQWRQAPAATLDFCRKFDPAGADNRQTAYVAWTTSREQDFAIFDRLGDDILPQLLPASANTSLRPSEMLNRYTNAEFIFALELASPEKKSKFCSAYMSSGPPSDPQWKEEAIVFLQGWLQTHPVRSAAK